MKYFPDQAKAIYQSKHFEIPTMHLIWINLSRQKYYMRKLVDKGAPLKADRQSMK